MDDDGQRQRYEVLIDEARRCRRRCSRSSSLDALGIDAPEHLSGQHLDVPFRVGFEKLKPRRARQAESFSALNLVVAATLNRSPPRRGGERRPRGARPVAHARRSGGRSRPRRSRPKSNESRRPSRQGHSQPRQSASCSRRSSMARIRSTRGAARFATATVGRRRRARAQGARASGVSRSPRCCCS